MEAAPLAVVAAGVCWGAQGGCVCCGRAGWPRALRWSCNQPSEGGPLRFGTPWVRMQQRRRLVKHLDLCANEGRKFCGAVDTGVLYKLRTLAEFAK